MKNRFAVCLMASLLALSPVSLSVGAAVQSEEPLLISANPMSEKTDGEPTAEALESIIKTVKPRLSVPENCTEFHFDYNGKNLYSDAAWSLSWSDPDSGMSVGVSCDEKGNLIRYNAYNPDENKKTAVFPEQPKEVYIETAKAFLSRTAPDAHLTLAESYDANGLYRPTYRYRFVRTENGLEVPSQYAYVEVNALTGAVTGCSVEYRYDTVINALQNPITPEKAKEFLHGQLKMELNYVANRTYDEDGTAHEKAVLVYSPSGTNFSVDAMTGKIYTERTEWVDKSTWNGASGGDMKNDLADSAESEGEYTLTEEEIAGTEQLKGLIGKEEAIRKVTDNKALYLDVRLSIADAALTRKGGGYRYYMPENTADDDSFVWRITFSMPERDADETDYYDYAYASAEVDAVTGKILRFDSSLHDVWYYEQNGLEMPKKQYDEAACEKILSDFAKENTDYFDNTRRAQAYDTNTIWIRYDEKGLEKERVYGAYGYRFVRVNEGLDYNGNYIVGTVDGVTGKISSFSTNWTKDLVFESPKDAISADEAYALYCDFADIDLFYEEYTQYTYGTAEKEDGDKLKNLILRLKKNPNNAEKILSEYAPELNADEVKKCLASADMDGLIALCAEYYGVDPVSAVNFYYGTSDLYSRTVTARPVYAPHEPYTYIGALSGKETTYNGSEIKNTETGDFTDIGSHWAEDYIEKLARVGVISRTPSYRPDEDITEEEYLSMLSSAGLYRRRYGNDDEAAESMSRLEAVKSIIYAMNLSRAAEIPGIYRTEFSDNPLIKEEDIGYLAIAYGLHIIEGDKGTSTFRPDDVITRGEAAKLVCAAVAANAD